MAFASDKGRQGAAGQGGAVTSYDIDNSLRLNDDDSAYLSKTPTTAGNRKTWTLSLWFKRGNLGSYWNVFGTDSEGECIRISTSDQIEFFHNGAASSYLKTSQVFRDPSAWYHVIWANDTTQSTPSDRVKIYINGEQVTAWASEAYPDEDSVFKVNQISQTHYLGNGHAPASSREFDGYLAEVNFIDGVPTGYTESEWQALDHSTLFGEFDATYGHWKPIAYDGTYGTNGFYLPMGDSSLVSASGGDGTESDGSEIDGKYKYHIFNQDGTFAVGSASAGSQVEYLVIAGGGGGASSRAAGGGGAGGYRTGFLTVSTTGGANNDGEYAITVGTGGAGGASWESSGAYGVDSTFSTITSTGGGFGSKYYSSSATGGNGGSGGGASNNPTSSGGSGNTPSTSPSQGYDGGDSTGDSGGGGGGSSSAGSVGTGNTRISGGSGTASSITGTAVTRASGGGGIGWSSGATGSDNSANTGNGGDGENDSSAIGRDGGSGVVIIRYKYQG